MFELLSFDSPESAEEPIRGVAEPIWQSTHQVIWRTEAGTLEVEAESVYPKGLQKIVDLFESLPEQEKRDGLISYADQASKWEPKEGETFDLEDIRKDEECTDTVGVFLKVQ